jgi:hypothetical protein
MLDGLLLDPASISSLEGWTLLLAVEAERLDKPVR